MSMKAAAAAAAADDDDDDDDAAATSSPHSRLVDRRCRNRRRRYSETIHFTHCNRQRR